MDGRKVGSFLNEAYPPSEDLSDLLALSERISDPLLSTLFPSVMIVVPRAYVTRSGRRVDICGTVDSQSDEYSQGLRYFSNSGELFYTDGKCLPEGDNPCDLVAFVAPEDLESSGRSVSPYIWVHPKHWPVKSWFHSLVPGKTELISGTRYLNRMGLVIEVTRVPSDANNPSPIFKDKENRRYLSSGLMADTTWSMFDLVSEVKHWAVFTEQDWSSDKTGIKQKNDHNIPELFDPTVESRGELMQRFFVAMAEVNSLADQLGIELGFSMQTA